jgi:hypothetical protein
MSIGFFGFIGFIGFVLIDRFRVHRNVKQINFIVF